MSAEIDWDTYEPTAAVRKAAILLSSADSVEATCFGWVPQAHEALATALDVEEMAEVIFRSDYEAYRSMAWAEQDEITKEEYRLNARALRTALLGADS